MERSDDGGIVPACMLTMATGWVPVGSAPPPPSPLLLSRIDRAYDNVAGYLPHGEDEGTEEKRRGEVK